MVRLGVCMMGAIIAHANATVGAQTFSPVTVSDRQAQAIGERIWQNETGGDWNKLIWWNASEGFPSLGIGHFIWYRTGHDERFVESFPAFVAYLKTRGVPVPQWLATTPTPGAPWRSRDEMMAARASPQYDALHRWLRSTVVWQTHFIIERFKRALPKVVAGIHPVQRPSARAALEQLQSSPVGLYALVDYVNFKGEGLNPNERYAGEGWGLKQVLEWMESGTAATAPDRFAAAASKVLAARVANAPPARREARWLPGWQRRLDTYRVTIADG